MIQERIIFVSRGITVLFVLNLTFTKSLKTFHHSEGGWGGTKVGLCVCGVCVCVCGVCVCVVCVCVCVVLVFVCVCVCVVCVCVCVCVDVCVCVVCVFVCVWCVCLWVVCVWCVWGCVGCVYVRVCVCVFKTVAGRRNLSDRGLRATALNPVELYIYVYIYMYKYKYDNISQNWQCSNPHKHFDRGCSINCSPLQ